MQSVFCLSIVFASAPTVCFGGQLYSILLTPSSQGYRVTQLEQQFSGRRLNNHGQVAGSVSVVSNGSASVVVHAALWDPATGVNGLGTIPGYMSYATDLNDVGEVVAGTWRVSDDWPGPDLIWNASTGLKLLCPDISEYVGSSGPSINNLGQVTLSLATHHAALWSAGVIQDLGVLSGGTFSIARSINDYGQIVGLANLASRDMRPFLWDPSTGMHDLGTLGGWYSNGATDINNAGQVVGLASTEWGFENAFMWDHGVMSDLNTLGGRGGSYASSINNAGQVVGKWCEEEGSIGEGFIWRDGIMIKLNDLLAPDERQAGWSVTGGMDINDAGVILALGLFRDKDGDGITDSADNCPNDWNADQLDGDRDAVGDVCDACPNDPLNDTDGDGVCGDLDACANSINSANVIIEGCSTDVANRLVSAGCNMADEISKLFTQVRRGQRVSALAELTNEWNKAGLITGAEKGRIQACAAKARLSDPLPSKTADEASRSESDFESAVGPAVIPPVRSCGSGVAGGTLGLCAVLGGYLAQRRTKIVPSQSS